MKNNNLTAAAAALTINTTVTASDLCTPAAPVQLPPCIFAGGRCWQCDHYSGKYCYKHMCPVDPEKYSCSYFQ